MFVGTIRFVCCFMRYFISISASIVISLSIYRLCIIKKPRLFCSSFLAYHCSYLGAYLCLIFFPNRLVTRPFKSDSEHSCKNTPFCYYKNIPKQ